MSDLTSEELIRFILLRIESIHFLIFIILAYFYIKKILHGLKPRIEGQNLAFNDLAHHLKFEAPEFMDRGFTDLQQFGRFWKLKHKNFSYCACQGFRSYMEDRMHYMFDPLENIAIFAIFDGHGGMYVSDYLESRFAHCIRQRLIRLRKRGSIDYFLTGRNATEEALVLEVLRIDDEISRLDSRFTNMTGSTGIAAVMEANRFLTVINVGDSRAVACDARGKARPLSWDHKPELETEKRRIEACGGFVSFEHDSHRLLGILALSRSFGDTFLKRRGVLTAHPDVVCVDLCETPLRFLIIGSDGFWDVVSNAEAVKFANQYLRSHGKRDWHRISTYLVNLALDRQTKDNVSALFIKLVTVLTKMSANSLCFAISESHKAPVYWPTVFHNISHDVPISQLNMITYAYIAPIIISVGIIGDILTVITLSHPLLRNNSIIYTYLSLLAMTDLLTHVSVIPMILWLLDMRYCSPAAAFYYAHIGFPLANALMGASVWIVVFLTLSQYMAVCRPFAYGLRSRKICFLLFGLAYVFNFFIYAPWSVKKEVHDLQGYVTKHSIPSNICPYVVCDTEKAEWFFIYEAIRELISRIFPFFLVAFLNARILITYKNTKKDRMERLANSQKRFVYEKSEKEEKRLFILLFAIIIVFFLCTIPAAPLTMLVADTNGNNFSFQIFRAVVNLLEFTKFALNFYFYCLINPEIRRICFHVITCKKLTRQPRVKGQPTTPISLYTRSTKNSTVRGRNGSSRRSSKGEEWSTRRDIRDCSRRSVVQAEALLERLTVIKETESGEGERV